jgi:5-methylcytosine-specific restriction endonuclease McrA
LRTKSIDRGVRDWYQLQRWRNRAKHQLQLEPFCAFCMLDNRAVMATIADHVTPHNGDANAFWLGELQSLCAHCHNSSKRRIDHGKPPRPAIGADGWPIRETHDSRDTRDSR